MHASTAALFRQLPRRVMCSWYQSGSRLKGAMSGDDKDDLHASIFVSSDAEIHQVPMSIIHRPLPSVLDQDKVSLAYRCHASLLVKPCNMCR